MKDAAGRSGFLAGGTHTCFLLRMVIAALAALLLPALAAAATGSDAPKDNPRLASLQIEIWPEFDRTAALVIMKGEIAQNVTLPASMSVRIPASSGGPSAVAFSSAASGDLLTAKYETESAGDRITLKFQVPQRFFHVEFYDPIAASVPERHYTYVWPGDLATDQLAVIVQEPAGTVDTSVTPELAATATGQNGLRYRSAELGAFPAGKQLEVNVRYTKTDPRTSTAILNPRASDSQTTTDMLKPKEPESSQLPFAIPSKRALIIWLVAVAAVAVLGSLAAIMWGRRRRSAPAPHAAESGLCRKCRAPAAPGDRFCSKCGTPMA